MASQITESICLLIFTLLSMVHSFMDIEELETINYGINIVKEPIVISETYPDTAILVTSRHGQQYQCNYPTHQEQKQQKEEEEKIALEMGVVELLKPLAQQPCLLKTKDWWTYEICYGKFVRQYHVEDGQIRGNVMYLGHYQSDFDWNNETLRESRVRSKIASGRYHSQYYTNGSKCDLTGNGRESEVRYLCEDTEDDYIVRVDEPETCVYVITVHTPRICSHPHLKSPTPSQPTPIVCAPLLTDQQYMQYQAHTEAQRKKEEEARARAKAEQEKRERERALAEAQEEDRNIEGGLTDSVNSILKKSLGKEIKNAESTTDSSEAGGQDDPGLGWKLARDLDDIEKLLDPQGILSNMDMSSKGQSEESPKATSEERKVKNMNEKFEEVLKQHKKDESQQEKQKKDEDDDNEEEEDSIEAAIDSELDEFEQEVKTLRDKQAMTQKRLMEIKNKVKKAVTSQFKEIIEEAEAEVGGEVNEALALRQLSSSLNMLMEKLEHTEQEMKDMDREIAKLGESEASSGAGKEEEQGGGVKEEEEEEEEEEEDGEKKKKEGGRKEVLAGEEEIKSGGVQAPPTSRQATEKDTKGVGRWKMRVRSVTQEELDRDGTSKMPPTKQQKHLEHSLKESLEKAGVDPNSVKVHVKIIGAGSSDKDDDATLHVLSEEDSASFQNMIVAILGGSNEAAKEQRRHEALEDGYNFMFDQTVSQDGEDDSLSAITGDDGNTDEIPSSSDSVPDMPEQGL